MLHFQNASYLVKGFVLHNLFGMKMDRKQTHLSFEVQEFVSLLVLLKKNDLILCLFSGRWKEIRHDNTVTWLAFWNDPINPREFKYVFLAASSSLKGQSDKVKYEKARMLKVHRQKYSFKLFVGILLFMGWDLDNPFLLLKSLFIATGLYSKHRVGTSQAVML